MSIGAHGQAEPRKQGRGEARRRHEQRLARTQLSTLNSAV